IVDPSFHHPRTFMPVTHLEPKQAADVAAWLLSQDPAELDPAWAREWGKVKVARPDRKTLEGLARVYLEKVLTRSELRRLFANKRSKERVAELPLDERELAQKLPRKGNDGLRWYVGRKAINRLGCFGCHDVPGFDGSKPIGTPLNDWGKKDPERM